MRISEHQRLPLVKDVCKGIPLKENLSEKVDSASHFRMYSLYTVAVQCAVSEPPASVARRDLPERLKSRIHIQRSTISV